MAAIDMFESFNKGLSEKEHTLVTSMAQARRIDLLAARSEDARLRIINEYLEEAHKALKHVKK